MAVSATSDGRSHERAWLRAAVFLRVNRWTDWLLVVALYVVHGAVLRARAAPVILDKWASAWQRTWLIEACGLVLGLLEDLCVCAALCGALYVFDKVSTTPTAGRAFHFAGNGGQTQPGSSERASQSPIAVVRRFITSVATATSELTRFAVYSVAFLLAALAPSIDHVTVRTRQVRVSSNLAALLVRERDAAVAGFQVDDDEWRLAAFTLLPTLALAVLVGLLGASWINLADWDIATALHRQWERGCSKWKRRSSSSLSSSAYERVYGHDSETVEDDDDDEEEDVATVAMPLSSSSSITRTVRTSSRSSRQSWRSHVSPCVLLGSGVALLFMLTLEVSRVSPSIVALIALNPTLTEPVRLTLGMNYVVMHHQRQKRVKPLSELVDCESEIAEFFDSDSLYRRTLGFQGPLAFDVKLAPEERPNVLVLVMESFRQRDSWYLLQAQAVQMLPSNVTLTPNFDKWAKRGVGFRNMWSTWRTSRSIETILFGQVPYDSVSDTGTTGGRADTELSGLPQLFKALGYDTIFTTGTRADYDDWDTFLPAHGFDDVIDMHGLAEIAETEMKLDVSRGNHVMTYWGIHDDLSLGVLSYLLRDKRRRDIQAQEVDEEPPTNTTAGNDTISAPSTSKPTQRAYRNDHPWFVTHYTISSHVPFEERPDWYFRFLKSDKAPDFTAFYEGHEHADLMKDYAEMRYFSDLVFGSFLDELKASGVLNDTIVVVVGDHGQAPERGSATPERDQVATTRVAGAIIAEGRLGIHAGTILDDATSQSDLLNTLADIVGVPDDGFVQSGIGRSLKRKPAEGFGQRPVYCNNPAGNSAVIMGYLRAQYFSEVSDAVQVFDIEHDPLQQHDLLDDRENGGVKISSSRRQQLLDACDDGRTLSAYFKKRWDGACVLSPTC